MAEAWLGALAWAEGSQKCRGIIPALAPKPKSAREKMSRAIWLVTARLPWAGKRKVPVTECSRENRMISAAEPVERAAEGYEKDRQQKKGGKRIESDLTDPERERPVDDVAGMTLAHEHQD